MEESNKTIYSIIDQIEENSEKVMDKYEAYIISFDSFFEEYRRATLNHNNSHEIYPILHEIKNYNRHNLDLLKSLYINSSRVNKLFTTVDDMNFKNTIESSNFYNELNAIMHIVIDLSIETEKLAAQTQSLSLKFNTENILQSLKNSDEIATSPLRRALEIILSLTHSFSSFEGATRRTYEIYTNTLKIIYNLNIDISIYKTFSKDYIKSLNEEKNNILNSFRKEIERMQAEHNIKYNDFANNLDRFSKSTNLLSTAVDAGLKNLNDLNERTQNLEMQFKKIIEYKTNEIDKKFETKNLEMTKKISKIESNLVAEEQNIKEAHKDFINLVGKAGIYELTENYKRKSESEEKEYRDYRKYTSWAIIAAIISTLLILLGAWVQQLITEKDTNYLFLAARLTLSLMFFVLAFYLSKQAAKHYECFQENHRTFLQLAALEPFMAKMNDDEKKLIRKKLISTYFNQNADGKFAPNGEEVSWLDVKSFLEKLPEIGKSTLNTSNNDSSKSNT